MNIPENWTFKNDEIARNFDKHVREQLPWYDIATDAIVHITRCYAPENGVIYDIGASTGNIGRALSEIIKQRNITFYPVESSEHMAKLYEGPGGIIINNAITIDIKPFDVAVCFLSLMFFPTDKRKNFIDKLIRYLNLGGCIIILDKEESVNGYLGSVFFRLALSAKLKAGVSSDEIIKKEMSLTGIQRPLDKNLIKQYGNATEFFRFGDFAGWVIEKRND